MLTSELRGKIDNVWNAFWSGGVSNPLEVIEQITYLLFIRGLDDVETRDENMANRLGRPRERRIFPEGKDGIGEGGGVEYQRLRWSRFRNDAPGEMYKLVADHVFPFIRAMAGTDTSVGRHMKDARFTIPTPALLTKVVDLLADIPMEDRDTKGDLYEYMLAKIASAGQNGQFRTPRHIIQMMVEMVEPTPRDTICDPACGTCGFLVAAGEYLRDNHAGLFREDQLRRHFHEGLFHGFDFDGTMLRIGSMNMILHGVESPDIRYKDSLAEEHAGDADRYSIVLANPPFAGSLDYETTAKDLQRIVKTKKTELLFLALFLRLLKPGGRAAVIVPDGVLFGSSTAHKALRRKLVEEHKLDGIVKLPSGVFRPYAGVSTAILFFTKTNSGGTDFVWFYEHWIWNDTEAPPRAIGGFYRQDELELAIQRRSTRKPLAETRLNRAIAGRPYQMRAIRAITKSFEAGERKVLLVMATGTGKTRTVISLSDVLMRAGWAKRILFLADRVSLVRQATNAFKAHLPDAAPVNLVTERTVDGRVFLSTYPTMMNLIDGKGGLTRPFGPGHFDLVVVDEAHRSIYQRYRAIFDYFDARLVGLTATPKEDIDRNTYALFDQEDGVPTDAYSLDEAVRDGHLVPPHAISVPLKIVRDGLKYDDLDEEAKDHWDSLEWGEEDVPDSVDAAEVNQRLFNQDTVDQVIAHVMERGIKVEGGDRLGKTIIFAKNQAHAEFIEKRFNVAYPHLAGHFARIITHKTVHAESLIDAFSEKESNPHIAISVDMLDTGIDIPEVVNLVFFKLIRSKTKFWQMIGRGTRLCPDLFGPGHDKTEFRIIDYCGNLEFFGTSPELKDDRLPKSLKERIFASRVDLVRAIDKRLATATVVDEGSTVTDKTESAPLPRTDGDVREATLDALQDDVAGMNLDSFVVRQKRRVVERYLDPQEWAVLDDAKRDELTREVAPLPSAKRDGTEEAKRFDLLMYQLMLALIEGRSTFEPLQKKLTELAAALETQTAIPAVARQAELLEAIQNAEWWNGLTVPELEVARRRLRDIVHHLERAKKAIVYSNFADEIGPEATHDLPTVGDVDFERFKLKARHFLREQSDTVALQKLRRGQPLTTADLQSLQQMLISAGIGNEMTIEAATQAVQGFGRFVRGLVGLDRAEVERAFADLLSDGTASADQIEFISLVIEHLTERGVMEPSLLYESPFTDIAPHGPDQVFDLPRIDRLFSIIDTFNRSAAA